MLARLAWLTAAAATTFAAEVPLADGWALQSSCEAKAAGTEVSVPGFATQGWHHTQVPSTVVAALVADKTYPDPFFGMNLRSFPGVEYRIGGLFSNLDMPENSPFKCSWWYRTEFPTPANYHGKTAWLHFDGINYRANIWLNGQKLADQADTVGPFRAYEFDVTKQLQRRQAQRSRSRGDRSRKRSPRHHLCRLESRAARQGHGHLEGCVPHRHRFRVAAPPLRERQARRQLQNRRSSP